MLAAVKCFFKQNANVCHFPLKVLYEGSLPSHIGAKSYFYHKCPKNDLRPQWASGNVPALEPMGSRFETRFHSKSVMYWTCCTLNHAYGAKCPPAGVGRKLGEESQQERQ
ncbi:hypothetical protein AVEN_171178-1 [Araneus ventricosus]|uniref:Uncharacterized protein n=1 Tax=Araneus ventricosus TaxID=182803 RepID=A0A4Y2FAI7_ARAVE|nr:hypothetical protein AVEN_171178-1 [Araneus ventricosus]